MTNPVQAQHDLSAIEINAIEDSIYAYNHMR
jgi:hypothetical protein